MVAVTGSLAVNNADEQADIDYLVVTVSERLWLCRAMMILLVRYAERSGDILCPNYILSAQALSMDRQDLFMARELVQMVPLYGIETYQQMREINAWSDLYLPNAQGPPPNLDAPDVVTIPKLWRPLRATLEAILKTRLGTKLEQWEMDRKIREFKQLNPTILRLVSQNIGVKAISKDTGGASCQPLLIGYNLSTRKPFERRTAGPILLSTF